MTDAFDRFREWRDKPSSSRLEIEAERSKAAGIHLDRCRERVRRVRFCIGAGPSKPVLFVRV